MRPVVGITAGFDPDRTRAVLHRGYPAAIAAAGGLPVVLPPLDPVLAPAAAEAIDGLMLSGGPDLDPVYFGAEPRGSRTICPERDRFELALLEQVVGRDKPILAICRGVQVLNVFAGGDLYQELQGIRMRMACDRGTRDDRELLRHGAVNASRIIRPGEEIEGSQRGHGTQQQDGFATIREHLHHLFRIMIQRVTSGNGLAPRRLEPCDGRNPESEDVIPEFPGRPVPLTVHMAPRTPQRNWSK